MKKLLFISSELPFPGDSGGKKKSMKLIYFLAQKYEVTVASPLKPGDAGNVAEFLQRSPATHHIHEEVCVPRGPRALGLSYWRNEPVNVTRSYSSRLKQRIAAIAESHDIILLDHYESGVYLPDTYTGTVVYHAHNSYFQIWERYAELPGNPAVKGLAKLEALRVKKAELKLANRADLVFAAPNDQLILKSLGVSAGKVQETLHLGDEASAAARNIEFARTGKSLLYVGTLTWEPNIQGLLWFIREVWPRIKKAAPDIYFNIVGKNPDPRIIALIADEPRIKLLGFVKDLETVYPRNRISVAPLLFGSGMKVKVLDAMARGIPTVTTAVGAESIDYRQGEHLLVANDPVEMAEHIVRLTVDSELWQDIRDASRALIRDRYSWRPMLNAMYAAIEAADMARNTQPTSMSIPLRLAHA